MGTGRIERWGGGILVPPRQYRHFCLPCHCLLKFHTIFVANILKANVTFSNLRVNGTTFKMLRQTNKPGMTVGSAPIVLQNSHKASTCAPMSSSIRSFIS